MTHAIEFALVLLLGYGLRCLQVAVRPDVPSTEWQLKRAMSRNRAVFRRSCVARKPIEYVLGRRS